MSNIPEIDADELKLITDCAIGDMATFSQTVANEKDSDTDRILWSKSADVVSHLTELGLLAEITEKHQKAINAHKQATGREFRIYEITAMGRALFQAAVSKPN